MADHAQLARLDLNLLVALDALLTEKSVTRAAERLMLSQPALSASLGRLRNYFGDQILARRGNTYELTPFAVRLSEHTSTALEAARRVFESQANWSPDDSTREFSVYGSDYGFVTVGRVVSRLAAERAPGVRLRFMLHNPTIVEDAATRLRSVDAMVIPHGHLSELPFIDLWRDGWVAIVAEEHAPRDGALTMADIERRPWVLTYQSATAFTSAARQVQQLGVEPRVEVVVESFLSLAHFVAGTTRIGLVQESLVPAVSSVPGVSVAALPFDATPIVNAVWWHPVHARDPEHAWLRGLFKEAGAIVRESVEH
ncbi:LysR family transcriptional regulator [Kineococcus sp. SYSU DK001]|uniref:LysR family transcriptional regulator n=1 Tax=Kineococcus sp. SYSU DK001 TaxID=3383122 RepID=UPI003D7E6347